MAKKQQNNELFNNIDIEGLEETLITVDVSPDDIPTEVIDDPSGNGEPENNQDSPPVDTKKDEKPEETDDTIIVDTGDNEEEDQQRTIDTDDDKSTAGKKEPKGGSTPDESESPVYLHAAALQENGVLPNFDLKSIKDLTPQDAILKINEHIQKQIDSSISEGVDEYKSGLGEKAINFLKSLEEGAPFEDLAENYTLEERFGGIDDTHLSENEELQEQVYRNWLMLKGFDDNRIDKMVKIAKDNEELLSESTDGLKDIRGMIKQERDEIVREAQARKKAAEERNKEMQEKINTTVNGMTEIFPGQKLTDSEKKELIKMITVPVEVKEVNGRKIPVSQAMQLKQKDPIGFETRLNYLIQQGFFESDMKNNEKLEKFFSKQESNASKKLIERLGKEPPVSKGGKPTVKGEDPNKDKFLFPQSYIQT